MSEVVSEAAGSRGCLGQVVRVVECLMFIRKAERVLMGETEESRSQSQEVEGGLRCTLRPPLPKAAGLTA